MTDSIIRRFLKHTATRWGHSKYETLERCPKLFDLRYNHKVHGRTTPRAASLGTVIHRGLAAVYWRRMHPQREAEVTPDFWRRVIAAGYEDEFIKLEATRLVSAHEQFWADKDEGFDKVVAVEKLVETEINGVPYSTRMDLVAKRRKLPIIYDHKSSSRMSDNTGTEFAMSGQLMGMVAVWPYKGKPVARINLLVKTNTPQFSRIGLAFTENQIARWKKDLKALWSDLTRYNAKGYFPRRYSACMGRYGPCEMFSLCHAGPGMAGEYFVPKGTNLEEALR